MNRTTITGVLLVGTLFVTVAVALALDGPAETDFASAETTGQVAAPEDGAMSAFGAQALPAGHPPTNAGPIDEGAALPPGHPPIGNGGGLLDANGHANGTMGDGSGLGYPSVDPTTGQIVERSAAAAPIPSACGGGGSHSVAQVTQKRAELKGTKVKLHATVVKRTVGVLGRTWLHVQDGSGDAANGSHDLVVTTEATPEIGACIALEGTVSTDKDLGSGYQYDVLVEDAVVSSVGG